MKTTDKPIITVAVKINAPVKEVWDLWTDPRHIIHWNYASDDWHTPRATNDLRVGGKFSCRMEAKDGSQGFDFGGKYTRIEYLKSIDSILGDDRTIHTVFQSVGNSTTINESFEAEQTNPTEMQRSGWQAILNNFKKYVEKSENTDTLHLRNTINKGGKQNLGTNA
jgi:uncharacterized protein YndB with AHSA1/START domain